VDHALPAIDTGLNFFDVVVAQALIQRSESSNLLGVDFTSDNFGNRVRRVLQSVIILKLGLAETAFEAAGVKVGGIGGNVGTVQVERDAVMEIEVALDGLQVDYAEAAHVIRGVDFVFFHHFAGALNDTADATLAHEHVVRFFGEH